MVVVFSDEFSIHCCLHSYRIMWLFCIVNFQFFWLDAANNDALLFGTANGNIESVFASFLIQQTEVRHHFSFRIFCVANRENDYIALITLNWLKIFDEEFLKTFFMRLPFVDIVGDFFVYWSYKFEYLSSGYKYNKCFFIFPIMI